MSDVLTYSPRVDSADSILRDLYDVLDSLLSGAPGAWAVFFGAGISAPSGVPTVAPLMENILGALRATRAERQLIRQAGIPFELFMETLREQVDIRPLLNVFRSTSPNYYHNLLAHLIATDHIETVVTTNFDTLLEQALSKLGMQAGKDFYVYIRPEEFRKIDWHIQRRRILKLHGCLSDPDSMYATLSQVASRRSVAAIHPPLESIFKTGRHSSVLILGYSCSDHFDITPAIRALGDNMREVILIDHTDRPSKEWYGEPLTQRGGSNPFLFATRGRRFIASTDELVLSAWSRHSRALGALAPTKPVHNGMTWMESVETWASATSLTSSRALAAHIIGRLLIRSGRFGQARIALKRSLEEAERLDNGFLQAQALLNLGICYYRLGQLKESLNHQRKALYHARKLYLIKVEGQSIGNIGNVHYSAGRLVLALRYQQQCLHHANLHGFLQLKANSLGNIGIIHEKRNAYGLARAYHRRAERLAAHIGDPVGEARHRFNIALAYSHEGKRAEARHSFREAERLAMLAGQDDLVASCLLGQARALDLRSRSAEIERCLLEALRLWLQTGEQLSILDCYIELGNYYSSRNRSATARDYLERAQYIARKLKLKAVERIVRSKIRS
jgi:tetratricopeptide (TPR) repeat protein/NAD-dependent SIR2 family protein deacetylase